MADVLVTGGTGKTGRRVVAQLGDAGSAARVAARRPPPGLVNTSAPNGRRPGWAA